MTEDLFGANNPSVSFKDAPIGTTYQFTVTGAPKMAQQRDFRTKEPATWPDGNPKMAVVTEVTDANGEVWALWAPKPSSMFEAIKIAQQTAGAQVAPGGALTIQLIGERPTDSGYPQKLYAASYQPGNVFADSTPAPMAPTPAVPPPPTQMPAPVPQAATPAPMPTVPPLAPTVPAPAVAPVAPVPAPVAAPPQAVAQQPTAPVQWTPEQIAAMQAAGLPIPGQ